MADPQFDQYEYVAVIIPGAALLLGLGVEWPQSLHLGFDKQLSLGDLGIFVVAAYLTGQLVQALAEIFERFFWTPMGGLPTNWVLAPGQSLISPGQRERLADQVKKKLPDPAFTFPRDDHAGRTAWFPITRQMYALLSAAQRASRIDAFNRTYGLMRGIAVAFLILVVVYLVVDAARWWLAVLALILAGLALLRFYLFGKDYARELFAQFLALP
jgi:hypothetical protein